MQSFLHKVKCAYLVARARLVQHNWWQHQPCLAAQLALLPSGSGTASAASTIAEIMNDGILWGVPKKRPSLERRLRKRFGVPAYPQNCAVLRPRTDLIICEQCGDHHDAASLCRTCYERVRDETDRLKVAIRDQTDPLAPKDREVVVRFHDDPKPEHDDKLKARIIELDRPRPNWFTPNLLLRSTPHTSRSQFKPKEALLRPEEFATIKDS